MGVGPIHLLGGGELSQRLAGLGVHAEGEEIDPVDEGLPEMTRVIELDRRLARSVRAAAKADRFPLVLAGNCNSCLGTVAGVGAERLGVIWFDTHADFDTADDNESGFFDAMGLSILTGSSFQPLAGTIPEFQPIIEQRVLLVGVRDLEQYQERRLLGSHVNTVFGTELRTAGALTALEPAFDRLRSRTSAVYLHVDLDSLDTSEGTANEYAAPGGLTVAELESAIELVFQRFTVAAAAVTAYDPDHDPEARILAAGRRVVARSPAHPGATSSRRPIGAIRGETRAAWPRCSRTARSPAGGAGCRS